MNVRSLEFRHSGFRIFAPAIALAATLVAFGAAFPSVSSWSDVTDVFLVSAIFAAPFLAGFGAWDGLRAQRRRLTPTERTAARDLLTIRTPQYAGSLGWVLLSSAAALLIITARAAAIGLDGSPNLASLLQGFLANLFAATLGFVVAELVRRWVAVAVAAAAVLALMTFDLLGSGSSIVRAAIPLHGYTAGNGLEPNSVAFGGQSFATLGVIAVLIATAMIRMSRREWATAMISIVAGGAAIWLGLTMIYSQGASNSEIVGSRALRWVTIRSPGGEVSLKVLSLYRPVAPELGKTWNRIARLTETSSLGFDRLTQDPAPDYGRAPYRTFFRLDLNPDANDIASRSVEMAFNDVAACATDAGPGNSDWWAEGTVVVRTWFEGAHRFPPEVSFRGSSDLRELQALYRMPLKQAQRWVRTHENQIRSCAWSRSDFPSG